MKSIALRLLKTTASFVYSVGALLITHMIEMFAGFSVRSTSSMDPGYVYSKKLEYKFITSLFLDKNRRIKEELSEFRECPVCLSNESLHFCYSQDGFEYVMCRRCQMIYTSRVLSSQAYQLYQENLMESEKEWTSSREAINDVDKRRFFRYLKQIKKHTKIGKLLDVGCFTGTFLECASKNGFKASGVEIHKDKANIAQSKGFLVYNGDFETVNPESTYDVITMFESLEHMNNPRNAIKKAYERLNKGGIIVITVPNGNAINARVLNGHLIWLTGMGHKNMFTPSSMRYLLKENGFNLLQLRTIDSPSLDDIINYFNNRLDLVKSFNNWQEMNVEYAIVRGSKLLSFLLKPIVEHYNMGALIFAMTQKA